MRPWWKPIWTRQAGMRALRATLVVPALFAICLEVIGDPQMTLFATFGGFAATNKQFGRIARPRTDRSREGSRYSTPLEVAGMKKMMTEIMSSMEVSVEAYSDEFTAAG